MKQVENMQEKCDFEMLKQAHLDAMRELKELREIQKESAADFDRRMKESAAEADKRQAEADKRKVEADKSMADLKAHLKELQNEIGGVGKSNGAMTEELIFNTLAKGMTFAEIDFYDIRTNMKKKIKSLNIEDEYDIVLTNGDTLAIIETKYKVKDTHISKLIGSKLDNFKKLYPEYCNYKILLGIGGMSFEKEAIKEAKENGVGIIKVVGEKVEFYTDGIKAY